jgi:hypothetical protein
MLFNYEPYCTLPPLPRYHHVTCLSLLIIPLPACGPCVGHQQRRLPSKHSIISVWATSKGACLASTLFFLRHPSYHHTSHTVCLVFLYNSVFIRRLINSKLQTKILRVSFYTTTFPNS